MYARYQKGRRLILVFELPLEVATAYRFWCEGTKATPFQADIKAQMEGVLEALKCDVLEKLYIEEEASHFQVCGRCATEVDLRKGGWGRGSDGMVFHLTCPALKSTEERDI